MKYICLAAVTIILAVPLAAQESGGDPVNRLEDITVTGTRTEKRLRDTPVVTEVITAEEIENSSASTVTEILDDYGIMYTGNAMGDYIQLQGMGESRVLFLIDGRRVVGRISSRLKGETMPLGNVERIEIVRGPQSALYGSDGIGGVINIITKKPGDEFSLSAAITNRFLLAYDDPGTPAKAEPFDDFNPIREQNLTLGLGLPLGPTRNSLTVEAARGDFYLNELKILSVLPEYYRIKPGFDTAFPLGDTAEMRLGGSLMLMRSDDQTSRQGSLSRLDYIRADGYVEAELMPMEDGILTLRAYDNFYQRDKDSYSAMFDTWATGNNHENENFAGLEALGVYEGLSNFLFTLGLEGAYNTMDKYNLRNNGTFAQVDKEALFLQAERFREETYSLIAGLRLERHSQYGFAAAPKLSAMYHLPWGMRVLGGAGVGYRAPDFSDLYLVKDDNPAHPVVRGNPELQPEYAIGFNLGLEQVLQDRLFAQVNGYYSELFGEIAHVDTGTPDDIGRAVYDTKNIARSFRTGVDTEGRLTILAGSYISAGYSWLFAYDRTEETELHLQPAHTVKMKAGIDHRKTGINTYLQGRFFSPLVNTDEPDYEARFLLDFYFSVSLGNFKIHASVDNITGLIHPLGPYTAQTFTVGLKYSL
jgi:outer membrane receptor for ferrienterochelin and colicins